MNIRFVIGVVYLTILSGIASTILWNVKIPIPEYQSNHDPQIHVVADFMVYYKFENIKAKDLVECAVAANLDYRILAVIARKESFGGQRFTPGTNNPMGIVYKDLTGKDRLVPFPSIRAAICKSGQLLANYKAATLEGKIKIYNSINPDYWPDTKRLLSQIK